ncbi:MAG TPA: hypothetical protein DF712_17805, partial [Balneola sp.]|nr:hypothetical protein [Balneola sp.]
MTLSDLQNSYLISAKSVKGPFEFTGKGKPSKLIKLLDRLLKSDEKIKAMPRGGINLKAAACYAALDPKNSA